MVHTRHSKDVELDSPPRFLALEGKRSRKSRFHATDVDEHDSDQSGTEYPGRDHSIFEDKVVESRLRPRRSYNYVYADSSDEERMARNRHVRIAESSCKSRQESSHQHRREMRRRGRDSSDEDEEEEPKQRGRWYDASDKPLRQTRSQREQTNHHREGEDEPDGDVNQEDEDEDDEDLNNCALRRSSRLRLKPFRFRAAQPEGAEDNSRNADRGKRQRNSDGDENEEYEDMYSRVKRSRTKKTVSRQQQLPSDDSNDDKNESEGETQQRCSYSLREHKPRTQLYMAPAIEAKKKPKQQPIFRETPPRQRHKDKTYRSPAHRKISYRKKHAFHGSSSSTSSDSDSGSATSDEQSFSRRKAKSLAKARARICPLNFTSDMLTSSVKDRVRAGASLADVDPMEIDKSVTFESVGGLRKHIMALKEMVVFPLLYPEFYDHFKVAPSRGVLFYGPPGTGKTLVARALANECSRGSQRVAFFMRKGADCLSKWVGEAERQLRLLFDKAYEMRPAIIFFDEIDGLAPVRSSRQDQIHSSIVSTLLALMDGIDARGEIVVIGATNRIDSIDPALRRPGRFDKEFHFPLPNLHDRRKILQIHTKNWTPPLREDFLLELAEKCAGYCGADIKCLVTEATQNALRRYYPQIYTTADKLQLNIPAIQLTARDFAQAMSNIVPAAQRAVANPAMALEASVRPLLLKPLLKLQALLNRRFPYARLDRRSVSDSLEQGCSSMESVQLDLDLASDEEDSAPSIFRSGARGCKNNTSQLQCTSFLNYTTSASSFPTVFRPRMLVSGAAGQGQSVHLAPAALHLMEHLPVHILNSSTLFAASAKMPEEACANVFHEAKRTSPSIIFMPYINELWHVVTDSLRVTFLTLVRSMNPSTPVLIMGTSEISYADLDDQLKQLFSLSGGEVMEVDGPTTEERHQFFSNLILQQTIRPPSTHKQAEKMAPGPFTFFPSRDKHKMLSVSCNKGSSDLEVPCLSEIRQSPDNKTHLPAVKPRSRFSKIRSRANLWLPSVNTNVLKQKEMSSVAGKVLSQGRTPALLKQCFVNLVKLPDSCVTVFSGKKTKNVTALNTAVLSCCKTGSAVAQNVQAPLGDQASGKVEKFINPHSVAFTGRVNNLLQIDNAIKVNKANFRVPKPCSSVNRKGILKMEPAKTCREVNNSKATGLVKFNIKNRVSGSNNKTSGSCNNRHANKSKNRAMAAMSSNLYGCKKAIYQREKTLTPGVAKNLRCSEVSSRCETLFKRKTLISKISKSSLPFIPSLRPLPPSVVKPQNMFASKKPNYQAKQKKPRTSDRKPGKNHANLNNNRSANSNLGLLQYPMAFVSASKCYPSLKSPYNAHHQLRPKEALRVLEPLKKALPPEPRKLTEKEQRRLIEQEEDTLRELRIFLRDIVSKIGREKKFSIFTKPVDIEEVPDYYNIIKKPMDLSTVLANIDLHKYNTATAFLDDIFLICSNALEYNPDRGPTDRAIRHRACALRDMAQALLKAELDPDFEKLCQEIEESRKSRGVDSSQNAPAFYHTRPLSAVGSASELAAGNNQSQGPTFPEGCRFSRRVRGLEADRTLPLEAVEKTAFIEKILLQNEKNLPVKESSQGKEDPKVVCNGNDPSDSIKKDSIEKTMEEVEATASSTCKCINDCKCSHSSARNLGHSVQSGTVKGTSSKHPSPEEVKRAKRLKSQSPWCRPRRRRRLNSMMSFKPSKIVSPVSDGEEISDEDETCVQGEHSLHRDARSWTNRHEREHSPVSAANPANVNVPGRSRPSLDCQTTSGQVSFEEASVAASTDGAVADPDNKGSENCGAARSLDAELVAAAIDSGLGSESNGDSRDSLVDQNNSNRSGIDSTGKVKGYGEDETATVSAGSSFAHTRSRTQNPLQMNALAALEAETQSVHVDKERLGRLLDAVVTATQGFTVEAMQQLYSVLSCSIYNHRREYDKTQLVQEMEQVIEDFCYEARH